MATKLSIPSIVGLDTKGVPLNVVVFLQAVEDALKTVDTSTVYKDQVTVAEHSPLITSVSAQGQAFAISGVTVASGDDYAALVNDVRALVQSHRQLTSAFNTLLTQLRGS